MPNSLILQALNQLFEKIMALDIEERHLLRLGHGEEALETEKDFSRFVSQLLGKWVWICEVPHPYFHVSRSVFPLIL